MGKLTRCSESAKQSAARGPGRRGGVSECGIVSPLHQGPRCHVEWTQPSVSGGVNGKTEKEIKDGYELFKKDKFVKAVSTLATKHSLDVNSVLVFVTDIIERHIFDGEKLYNLSAPLELGWKDRARKEEDLMKDLIPILKRMAGGQKISGLSAYEDNK